MKMLIRKVGNGYIVEDINELNQTILESERIFTEFGDMVDYFYQRLLQGKPPEKVELKN